MGSRGINKVIIVGNVGADPEVRSFDNGKLVANLSLVTSDTWRDKNTGENKETSEWHRVVVYGSAAKIVQDYVSKGMQLYIEGKLRTRNWQDQSGKTNYITEIHVDGIDGKLQMLGSVSKKTQPQSNGNASSQKSNNTPPPGDYSNLPPSDIYDDQPPF